MIYLQSSPLLVQLIASSPRMQTLMFTQIETPSKQEIFVIFFRAVQDPCPFVHQFESESFRFLVVHQAGVILDHAQDFSWQLVCRGRGIHLTQLLDLPRSLLRRDMSCAWKLCLEVVHSDRREREQGSYDARAL